MVDTHTYTCIVVYSFNIMINIAHTMYMYDLYT